MVLRKARDLFWQKGYAATSIDDLLKAMKLNRGCLYAAFGSKRNLFFEVLRNYHEEVVNPALHAMGQAEVPLKGVRTYLEQLVDRAITDRTKPGSLLTNTVTELANVDEEVRTETVRVLGDLRNAFADAVRRAQSLGHLPPDTSISSAAMSLLGTCQAIHVLGNAIPDRNLLLSIVDMGMASLHAPAIVSS
jgi:TetR/AcrR family transcriptional repressor of nem operon